MNLLSRKLHELEDNILDFPPEDDDIMLHVGDPDEQLLHDRAQTKMPFYILTSNPQIIHGNLNNWNIARLGHASRGRESRINNEIRCSLSRKRISASMRYIRK